LAVLCLASVPLGCSPTAGDSASDGLVLVQVVAESTDIMRVRLADGAVQPLTDTTERDETWPYWSEPAKRLVFQTTSGNAGSDLIVWSEQLGEKPLAPTPDREARWPAWSPVQPRLAYAFRSNELPPSGVAVADLVSGKSELLGHAGSQDIFLRPNWSPDGATLVAQRRLQSGRGSQLWLLKPEAPPEPLTSDDRWIDYKPFFTRDGASIVYSRKQAPGGASQIVQRVFGGETRQLAAFEGSSNHSARPSPSRDEDAFVSDRSGRPQIYLMEFETGNVQQLGEIAGSAFAPRWSPNGELLAVTVSPPDTADPRLADRESLANTRVVVIDRTGRVHLDLPGLMPDWMPPWH